MKDLQQRCSWPWRQGYAVGKLRALSAPAMPLLVATLVQAYGKLTRRRASVVI